MMKRPTRRLAVGFAGIGLVSALAGCATGTADAAGNGGGTGGSGVSGPYTDGTYTEDGSYLSPAGEQTVTVKVTLAGDKISSITVTPHATDPTAKEYQAMFLQGIGAIVTGKDIDKLSVSRVAGSSLTSGGFNKAVDAIKADAKS
ncbi:MAG: FMN-binding protein [Pseudolysinimonas sp.]